MKSEPPGETFACDRAGALQRLAGFAPRMGPHYAAGRNTDAGPGQRQDVSRLSPALRHRLVTEREVVATALATHGLQGAEKFIQEVFWRSYWKGFLELRPELWVTYQQELAQALMGLRIQGGSRRAAERAEAGETGIACFDAWMTELRETGWLHNHARMWFASIWIFTLRLPWTLGADLFLRHLLDGDAASNTLSWRWVAGMQTRGKHYVARAENIARYTNGRFDPRGELEENPLPLEAPPLPPVQKLRAGDALPRGPVALLLHEDDLHAESLLPPGTRVTAVAGLAVPEARSPLGCSALVAGYVRTALADGVARAGAHFNAPKVMLAPRDLAGWIAAQPVPVVSPWAPVGWTAEALAGVKLLRLRRGWDDACWPRATKGFFPFKAGIPALIEAIAA